MTTERKTELENLLRHVVAELDLTPSERDTVEKRYQTISEWLEDPKGTLAIYMPHIYPHGSFRLGTVVRPLGEQVEFDLDFVCRLKNGDGLDQETLRDLIGDRLKANGKWEGMITPKTRCWRLNYANEFHVDIMPAIKMPSTTNGGILITDRDYEDWKASNPRGYAEWFDRQMTPVRRNIRAGMMIKMAAEDLPDEDKIKTPLQRAIQILKRHRDIYFEKDQKDRPGSIILTTLAAKAYRQQESLIDTLLEVAEAMPTEIEYEQGFPVVSNPALLSENLAEKWKEHPQRLVKFEGWLDQLQADVRAFIVSDDKFALQRLMGEKFGNRVVNGAFEKRAAEMKFEEGQDRISVVSGSIAPVMSRPVPKHDFFGGCDASFAYRW